MSPLRLGKRVPEENQFRFYRLLLIPTLFGEWSLVREWGRIGQSSAVRIDQYATEEAAVEFERRARQKQKRGYRRSPSESKPGSLQ